MSDQFAKVLDLARQVKGGTDQEFTGEFHPDPEEVRAWQTPLPQTDDGEFRYANKSPMELRRMIEVETDLIEKKQMVKIMDQFIARRWAIDPDDPRATRAGEPYRGEPKPDVRPVTMLAMGKAVKPVSHVVVGDIDKGVPEIAKGGEGLGMVECSGGIWEEV